MVFWTRTDPGDEVSVRCVRTKKSENKTQMLSVRKTNGHRPRAGFLMDLFLLRLFLQRTYSFLFRSVDISSDFQSQTRSRGTRT